MNNIDRAYEIYREHIYSPEKSILLQNHGLKVAGSVSSVMWELFGSVLTGCMGEGVTGADLHGWEVKSSIMGASFEYQYHLNTGLDKLREDRLVKHLYCNYSRTYEDVEVRVIDGSVLAPHYFDVWRPEYERNYDKSVHHSQRRQRFRKSIPNGFVQQNGRLVLRISQGKLVSRDDNAIDWNN